MSKYDSKTPVRYYTLVQVSSSSSPWSLTVKLQLPNRFCLCSLSSSSKPLKEHGTKKLEEFQLLLPSNNATPLRNCPVNRNADRFLYRHKRKNEAYSNPYKHINYNLRMANSRCVMLDFFGTISHTALH